MEQEKKSTIIKVVIGILAVVIIALAVFCASRVFRLESVEYEGLTVYTPEEMNNYIFNGKENVNTLVYYVLYANKDKSTIPFIQSYDVKMEWPDKIKIRVYEKSVIGYVNYMGCNMYFDKDGIVVDSSLERLEGVAEITGLAYNNIVLHSKLDVENDEVFDIILNLSQLLQQYGLDAQKIYFDAALNVTIYIDEVKIQLGSTYNMTEKLYEVSQMWSSICDLSGTLRMDTYSEDATSYIFEKNN